MKSKPTTEELRALVAELKPRSPQEVMGAAASSNLMASMITATVTGIGLLLGATFLMFALGLGPTNPSEKAQAADNQNNDTASKPAANDPDQKGAQTQTTPAVAGDLENAPDSVDPAGVDSTENAIEAMGIGETADPDSKPDSLENRLDKILDGLE